MMSKFNFSFLFSLQLITLLVISNFNKNIITTHAKTTEQVDSEGKYILSWEIDNATDLITFEIEVETIGYVGLGISPNGQMTGADLFIGGINKTSNSSYHSDYHGTRNGPPTIDLHQDWELLDAFENDTHTYLKVSRLLNTCDEQDYPITESTTRVIWSMGQSDELNYHVGSRGAKSVEFIHLPLPDVDIEKLNVWNITVNMTLPPIETTYWCSFHKRMPLDDKHHIVGFEANLINAGGVTHTHHFIAKRCSAPPGVNATEIFEPLLDYPGDICFTVENSSIAASYCSEFLFAWAAGGKLVLFPEDVGFPVGDAGDDDLYYLMETHFDNPQELANVHIETGLHVYYTPELRKHDATLLTVGRTTSESIIVPPGQTNYTVAGHCSSTCTSRYLSEDGIKIFNIGLHAHTSGRKLKLRHFRNNTELPWIAFDDNFDFNYQQGKGLNPEVIILPGDQLTYECVYDSTWNNNKSVIGGLSSRDEMCFAFMWVYGNTTMNICESFYDFTLNQTMTDFGITNYTWDRPNGISQIIVLEPQSMAGMNFSHALSTVFNWTSDFINEQEFKARYGQHEALCGMRSDPGLPHYVQYISVEEPYVPQNPCVRDNPSTDTGAIHTIIPFLFFAQLIITVFQF